MSIPALPTSFSPVPAPFVPVGKQAVAEQEREVKNTSSLKAIDESAESERTTNRRDRDAPVAGVNREADDARQGEADQEAKAKAAEQQAEQQQEIRQLASRDREVRAHEQAHVAAGGIHAGAAQYTFERGPDGVSYAVAGEVSIDTSAVPGDPQATINKAQQIRRAALAPAEPSAQDRQVAAQARQLELSAQRELLNARLQDVPMTGRPSLSDLNSNAPDPGSLLEDMV